MTTLNISSLFNCASPIAVGSYVYTDGRRARGSATNSTCTLNSPLMILSTSSDPATGIGVGLYVSEEPNNFEQVQEIGAGGTVTRENHRIASVFAIDYTDSGGKQFYALRLRNYVSGLFAPDAPASEAKAGWLRPNANGSLNSAGTCSGFEPIRWPRRRFDPTVGLNCSWTALASYARHPSSATMRFQLRPCG